MGRRRSLRAIAECNGPPAQPAGHCSLNATGLDSCTRALTCRKALTADLLVGAMLPQGM
ncbi:hypothetical protein CLOSTASPAR_01149 [[Clostridium] asparagiforme DSM 15981]|uniref:Uncharacterized protein n=1 Tax=[Clostridium] asparagiforme DSM 15981 TaxID=518636 RepID=C0CVZ5_9FIRM|nr:hypothetical protein CLOSTASPAR_01149 [[Clostridium] asparagiforme DSM 15981]